MYSVYRYMPSSSIASQTWVMLYIQIKNKIPTWIYVRQAIPFMAKGPEGQEAFFGSYQEVILQQNFTWTSCADSWTGQKWATSACGELICCCHAALVHSSWIPLKMNETTWGQDITILSYDLIFNRVLARISHFNSRRASESCDWVWSGLVLSESNIYALWAWTTNLCPSKLALHKLSRRSPGEKFLSAVSSFYTTNLCFYAKSYLFLQVKIKVSL